LDDGCRKKVRTLKIKKVDDKPMVIHTKEKAKFSDRILKRYLVYTKDLSKEQDIICIPVYMVPFL
jgi:hypothetical protein